MKRKLIALARRYATALRKYLKQGPRASLQPARELGRQAVAIGLETLDVARIHDGAVAALEASGSKNGIIKRAEIFFNEAITPIENTHHAALKTKARLSELNETLGRRTVDLAASNRSLKKEIVQHNTAEKELKKDGRHCVKLLRKSHQLQKHLRLLTHKILTTQEAERKKFSHQLQDDIAQTLLGINVRLLTLKKAAKGNTTNLKREIANTQRLVEDSVQSINRFARELDIPHKRETTGRRALLTES